MAKIIVPRCRSPLLVAKLTALWERSVRATHDFLAPGDIAGIRKDVEAALPTVEKLLLAADGRLLGFMGLNANRLEMLFLEPGARGKGIGRQLLEHAIRNCGVDELAVNEQNAAARAFYERLGFRVCRRTDRDEQGRPYPLLHMKPGGG